MPACPICQSENPHDARSCHYCGASLIDRRQQAPSRPAPALFTRPQSIEQTSSDQHSAQTYTNDSTLNLSIDTPQDSDGGSLTIDDFLDEMSSDASGDKNLIASPKLSSSDQITPGLNTIDEASDGLMPINLDTPLPELSFPDEPKLSLGRPHAKLSDLSGMKKLNGVIDNKYEPRFGNADSLNQTPHSGLSGLANLSQPQVLSKPSKLGSATSFGIQVIIFFIVTTFMLWSLGFSDSLLSIFNSNPEQPIKTTNVNMMGGQYTPTTISLIGQDSDQNITADSHKAATNESESQGNSESIEDEIIFDEPSSSNEISKSKPKGKSKEVKTKVQGKKKTKRRSSSYTSLMKMAENDLMRGRVKTAERKFNQAKKLKPNHPDPLAQLAWCKLAAQKTAAALVFFKQALSINPTHADSLYGLGYAYEKMGNSSQAIKFFDLYLTRYPKGGKVGVIKNKLRRLKR